MPVTAKLSRKFYDQFGDDIATEFVDWFNAVDTEYQRQYREANDLNWERFKAYSRADMAEFRQSMDLRFSEFRESVDARLGEFRRDLESLRSEMHAGFAGLRAEQRESTTALRIEMSALRSDMMKWMFIYWSGSIITLGGLMFALLRMK